MARRGEGIAAYMCGVGCCRTLAARICSDRKSDGDASGMQVRAAGGYCCEAVGASQQCRSVQRRCGFELVW